MKRIYVVIYKFDKNSKQKFKLYNDFMDAMNYYLLKSEYCIVCKLAIYEELVCGE